MEITVKVYLLLLEFVLDKNDGFKVYSSAVAYRRIQININF
jgi:hypothetical protein